MGLHPLHDGLDALTGGQGEGRREDSPLQGYHVDDLQLPHCQDWDPKGRQHVPDKGFPDPKLVRHRLEGNERTGAPNLESRHP